MGGGFYNKHTQTNRLELHAFIEGTEQEREHKHETNFAILYMQHSSQYDESKQNCLWMLCPAENHKGQHLSFIYIQQI